MIKHIPLRSARALALSAASFAFVAAVSVHAQYCEPDGFTLGVEPICRLTFANIDNESPSTSDAPANEDFTALVAQLEQGATYTVTASGYTGGTPPNSLAANFDWDGDEVFETHVELADITGDFCSAPTTASFTVPADAAIGTSRVRFVKTFSYSATDDGCLWSSSFGQSEDYTVNVVDAVGIADNGKTTMRLFPNPGNGDFTVVNNGTLPLQEIAVLDLTGRLVHTQRVMVTSGANHRVALQGQLPSGAYMVLVNDGVRTMSTKLLVQ